MRVTRLTSLKTVRPIFQEVPSSEALNAIKINPTKGKSDLVNWERDSWWELVAPIRDHHQLLSPQNHLLLPEMSLHGNYSPFLSQSSSVPPQFSQSHSITRSGFSSQVPHINKADTTQLFSSDFFAAFHCFGRFVKVGHSFVGLRGPPAVQPPAPPAQHRQAPSQCKHIWLSNPREWREVQV